MYYKVAICKGYLIFLVIFDLNAYPPTQKLDILYGWPLLLISNKVRPVERLLIPPGPFTGELNGPWAYETLYNTYTFSSFFMS